MAVTDLPIATPDAHGAAPTNRATVGGIERLRLIPSLQLPCAKEVRSWLWGGGCGGPTAAEINAGSGDAR